MNRQESISALPVFVENGHGSLCAVKARHTAQNSGLAAAGMPEQGGDARAGQGQVNVQTKPGKRATEAGRDAFLFAHLSAPDRALPLRA